MRIFSARGGRIWSDGDVGALKGPLVVEVEGVWVRVLRPDISLQQHPALAAR